MSEAVAEVEEIEESPSSTGEATVDEVSEGPIHPIQKLMDNPWLLLALGLLIPILSYTVWGWIELMMVPPAQLP